MAKVNTTTMGECGAKASRHELAKTKSKAPLNSRCDGILLILTCVPGMDVFCCNKRKSAVPSVWLSIMVVKTKFYTAGYQA